MSCISLQMINYIRTHKIEPAQVKTLSQLVWKDDIYMKPVVVDSWLMFGKETTCYTNLMKRT